MKTRIIKQVIKKDGKISKRSKVLGELSKPVTEYDIINLEIRATKIERRLNKHLRLFWLMGICIVVLVILEVL